ncbi:adenylosuccinate lyase [soil metagenome]
MTLFNMLERMYGDDEMARIFGEGETVRSWLDVEVCIARSQAQLGIIPQDAAEHIAAAAVPEAISFDRLWAETRNVGYPILPLIRMVAEKLPPGPGGYLHLGATTQDIMDTGLVLQMLRALQRLDRLTNSFGIAVAELVTTHRNTVMAARTHGQQAVPTTFGAKMSVYLHQISQLVALVADALPKVAVLSLHGAAGTSAALGERATELRRLVAAQLGLAAAEIPWHAARDPIWEFCQPFLRAAAVVGRLAREITDLARTEIAEVAESSGHHRGASSTMPQKENPILAETAIGFASATSATASSLGRVMEVVHERAAGEWQLEWLTVGRVAHLGASAVMTGTELIEGLRVQTSAMERNLGQDSGLIMAEAYMMKLAPLVGRERAHDLVYEAAMRSRTNGQGLVESMQESRGEHDASTVADVIEPCDYLGHVHTVCDHALRAWSERTRLEAV